MADSQVAEEVVSKWNDGQPDDQFPLGEQMFLFAVKAALVALLGDKFRDDKEALAFKHSYDVVSICPCVRQSACLSLSSW